MECRYAIKGSSRRAARLSAVQLMYQIDQSGVPVSEAVYEFEKSVSEQKDVKRKNSIDTDFFKRLLYGVIDNKEKIDQQIQMYFVDNWSINKTSPVLMAIFRVAFQELFYEDTPHSALINEYIEITKNFFLEAEVAFVNSLLDRVAKKIQLEGLGECQKLKICETKDSVNNK